MQNKKTYFYILIGVAAVILIALAVWLSISSQKNFLGNNTPGNQNNGPEATKDETIFDDEGKPIENDGGVAEENKEKRNIDTSKNPDGAIVACKVNNDCGIRFDTCGCKTVCRNVTFHYFDDCMKACEIDDTDFRIQLCKCENNQCVQDKINPFNKKPFE